MLDPLRFSEGVREIKTKNYLIQSNKMVKRNLIESKKKE